MTKKIYTSKLIFDGINLLSNHSIVVEDGQIIDVVNNSIGLFDNYPIYDLNDEIISPGFIDLQLNGCGGVLFNDAICEDTLEIMYQTCLRFATTSFLPTLISCDFSDIERALGVVRQWFTKHGNRRGVVGLHLEGPFISLEKKGIHPAKYIIVPTDELLNKIVKYAEYFPIKMTIAPEVFTPLQIKFLVDNGIILSLGHSNASYANAKLAFDLGVKATTHTFNAMSGMTARNPGVIGATLLSDNIYSGIIVDGVHVDYANLLLLYKLKPDRLYLVTDAVTPMGTDLKEFSLAGKLLKVEANRCVDDSGTLGGANLTLPDALNNLRQNLHLDILVTLKMATSIPADVLSLTQHIGFIKPGCMANLIAINPRTFVSRVIK